MNFVIKFLVRFIGIIFSLTIFNKILQFFGIKLSSYILYMLWLIAIIIFYYILPNDYEVFK